MLSPFVIAFVIAYLLKRPVIFLSRKLHLPRKPAAVLLVLVFYSTIGLLISLLGIRAFSTTRDLVMNLPQIYAAHVEPVLTDIFGNVEQGLKKMDPSLVSTLEDLFNQFIQSIGQMVSSLSMSAMGTISGVASSLPGLFIKLLLMIISTFFIAADYELLTGFFLKQLDGKSKQIFLQVKKYVVGTLFVCIRSYALIMTITFIELSVGLSIIGVKNSILIAFLISVFDILPVLGTGGIMIPWTIIAALTGDYSLSIGLLIVYLIITVIRNIIEPKIVGSQIGLHPVVTLASMFVGVQLLGVVGLFGFPISLSLLRHLNDNGTIHLFK
ncbi:sporulation integral membrane protein YtvI [Eisenbergiella tayi]